MKQTTTRNSLAVAAALGLGALALAAAPSGAQQPEFAPPPQAVEIDERQLEAFVDVYMEIEEVRVEYEPQIQAAAAADPDQALALQQEAEAKTIRVLEEEGMSPEEYNQILATVNADDQLRAEVLARIEAAR